MRAGIAVLEIGAAGTANEQRVAGKDAVGEEVRIRVVGMPGRIDHVEAQSFDFDAIAFRNPHRHHVSMRLLAHNRNAMRVVAQRAEAGNVVGVQMGVDRLD